MSELVELIEEMRNGHFADRFQINPPATLEEITYAEQQLGRILPDFYKAFLQLANGVYIDHGYMYFFSIYLPDKPISQVLASEHFDLLTKHLSEDELASFVSETDLLAQNHPRLLNEAYEQSHIRVGHSILADLLCQEGDERLFSYDHELYGFDDSWTMTSCLQHALDLAQRAENQKMHKTLWQRLTRYFYKGNNKNE